MDKFILVQYCDMKEEIKDIRRRIGELEKSISKLGIVSDSVKGTRKDGTYGSIKITGYPAPSYYQKKPQWKGCKISYRRKRRNCWS